MTYPLTIAPAGHRLMRIGDEVKSILTQAISYWKASSYNGSGDLQDLSGNGNHFRPFGPIFQATAQPHFLFDRTLSHYMETITDGPHIPVGDYTFVIAARIPAPYPTVDDPNYYTIMSKGLASGSNVWYFHKWNLWDGIPYGMTGYRFTNTSGQGGSYGPRTGPLYTYGFGRTPTRDTVRIIEGSTVRETVEGSRSVTDTPAGRWRLANLNGETIYLQLEFYGAAVYLRHLTDAEMIEVGQELLAA